MGMMGIWENIGTFSFLIFLWFESKSKNIHYSHFLSRDGLSVH
jgi:hypothetical protein